jgi:NAD(P)-dependent dehydrogenase (short-subunit alcohol dehydrogenase family)
MSRIFVTGSSDGIGQMTARLLIQQGHRVVLHARNAARARTAGEAVPGAEAVLTGDLSSLAETRALAEAANATGRFDAVIHNAGIGFRERRRVETADGLAHVFAINTLAPYLLTALMIRPQRLVYVSSELHRRGDITLADLNWEQRPWRGNQAYSDTKLHDVLLAFAIARRWPEVRSNAIEPGWVPTKMGGAHATGDLDQAHRTQVWLATSDDAEACVSGGYFYHERPRKPRGGTGEAGLQDRLLAECARLSGVSMP